MKKTVLTFGILVLALLLLFQISSYTIIKGNLTVEIVIALVAVIFFVIGIYLNKKSLQKSPAQPPGTDLAKIEKLGLTDREYEVLQEISMGLSNREIADKLFISESTIKTHVSNLLVKLDAKRRTHAIQIAKAMQIIK
ncbi:MAG TPA: response regulator transcription factor [Eudoraea sp.]|nr:response regulator transcription factor [Eudoraea sp.]